MKAMILNSIINPENLKHALVPIEIPIPEPYDEDVLIKVSRCGVCHTELDEIEGRTPPSFFPVILGHQAIGVVVKSGKRVSKVKIGDRVGVSWIFSSCGNCEYCRNGNENLCKDFKATGRDVNGGYAEYMVVSENYAFKIPDIFSDSEAAPLLCAGAIGYRSLRLTGITNGQRLGLTGFGASAHLVLKLVKYKFPLSKIYVFARSKEEQKFALDSGATWAGDTSDSSPEKLHAIIDTTPAWKPVIEAMNNLEPGGRLVINAIRKEEKDKDKLMNLDYSSHLWLEKEIKSVANVTRKDVAEFLQLAAEIPILPVVEEYPFMEANRALTDLKEKNIRGAKVLVMN